MTVLLVWQSRGLWNIMDLVSGRNNVYEKTNVGMGFVLHSVVVHRNLHHRASYRYIRRLFTTFDTDGRPGLQGCRMTVQGVKKK